MKKELRRDVEVVVISDVHLGTYGCQAEELLQYLKTINPKKLVLNGDIIDMWQFSKRYWPSSHMQIIKYITSVLSHKTEVVYITGNHDEMLRRFVGFKLGSFRIENKLVLKLNGKKAWFFHGDVFDVTMQYSKWLAKLGAVGYDSLIILNTFVNFCLRSMGRGKISLSKRIKDSVKTAVKFIDDFETTAADIAIDNKYDYVICGHIHQPQHREISTSNGKVTYLNSGDWVENMTALEYNDGQWSIYDFRTDELAKQIKKSNGKVKEKYRSNNDLFQDMVTEFLTVSKK
ncbi:MAG: UDP-2,3-diacylglucosamine diphosphatase [Fulvivirga sp.]|uniref:UDP-2,3-diacylglucosamine diphosphatase n=1 Tax=Fulvivirga sp. TaxID=1931237 RepID=UPI0032EEC0C4